jgi:hypothetical protein
MTLPAVDLLPYVIPCRAMWCLLVNFLDALAAMIAAAGLAGPPVFSRLLPHNA